MRVSEVMTANPVCCIPSDTAQTAAIIMRDEDIGIVPIVEAKGSRKLVGVVTDRDLCVAVIAEQQIDPTNLALEQCMTGKLVMCREDDDLEKVVDLMQENQVRRVPVVNKQNEIQGIVSLSDVVNRGKIAEGETRETLKSITEPTGEPSKPRAEWAKSTT